MERTIERHDDGTFTEYDTDGSVIGYGDWRDEPDTADESAYVAYYVATYPNLATAIPWDAAHETTKNRIRREYNWT